MHARVATFEGGDADQVREAIEGIKVESESGPPEGVPAVGFLLLHRPDEGKVLAVSLFESEAELEQGNETLSSMDPPGAMGQRTSVELYEVGLKFDA
jgi:hypothetical protein